MITLLGLPNTLQPLKLKLCTAFITKSNHEVVYCMHHVIDESGLQKKSDVCKFSKFFQFETFNDE